MLKNKKKFMIPVIAMLLLVAMAGSAFAAAMQCHTNYYNFTWGKAFDTQKRNHEDTYQTYLVQRALNRVVATKDLYVDGDFGPSTEGWVIRFQKEQGLKADGIVGKVTWNAMQGYFNWSQSAEESYDRDTGLHYIWYKSWSDNKSYIRHYENGRWGVQRGNLDWRFAK
jgi:hypothetical protein